MTFSLEKPSFDAGTLADRPQSAVTWGGTPVAGRLIRRYKRFFAEVAMDDGRAVTAHCPNTGSMATCGSAGDLVILSHNPSPKRKLDYTWQLTVRNGGYVGVNTALPNRIIGQALRAREIREFSAYDQIKPEPDLGNGTRLDFLLQDGNRCFPDCYVEVKNVTLINGAHLEFPDAVSVRASRHLRELTEIAGAGRARAALILVANCSDGVAIRGAAAIDPVYCEALAEAAAAGVLILGLRVTADPAHGVSRLSGRLPVITSSPDALGNDTGGKRRQRGKEAR